MAKRDGCLVVARGAGWALSWPRERWEQLTPEQQQDVIDAQAVLMSQNGTQDRTRRRGVGAQTSQTAASAHQGAG